MDNYLLKLLGDVKDAGSAGKDTINKLVDLLTKPSQNDGSWAKGIVDYAQDTPNRFGRNVNAAFPNPGLLTERSVMGLLPEQQQARETVANSLLNFGGMMIGPKAKTWNAADNARALEMEAAGLDPRQIWKDTGNWKGPEGAWRQEIPDNAAQMIAQKGASFEHLSDMGVASYPSKVGNVIDHPELFGAYPSIQGAHVTMHNKVSGGEYSPNMPSGNKRIEAFDLPLRHSPSGGYVQPEMAKSTTLHELQHAIQGKEGFAKGGDWDQLSAHDFHKEVQRLVDKGVPLEAAQKELEYLTPYYNYTRLAGEAEARATQSRMMLDALGRRNKFPADSYDVPLNELLIRR